MNFNIDLNKLANTLTVLLVVGAFGFYFDFQTVKGEVEENTKNSKKIDVVAKIVCLKAIQDEKEVEEKNQDHELTAAKICGEILKERSN